MFPLEKKTKKLEEQILVHFELIESWSTWKRWFIYRVCCLLSSTKSRWSFVLVDNYRPIRLLLNDESHKAAMKHQYSAQIFWKEQDFFCKSEIHDYLARRRVKAITRWIMQIHEHLQWHWRRGDDVYRIIQNKYYILDRRSFLGRWFAMQLRFFNFLQLNLFQTAFLN